MGARHSGEDATATKSAFSRTPQSGQHQVSGTELHAVPAGKPSRGAPTASSYTQPHPGHAIRAAPGTPAASASNCPDGRITVGGLNESLHVIMCDEEVGMPGARLREHDRQVIERGVQQGLSVVQIAGLIGKHRTTVARELERGTGARAGSPTKGSVVPGVARRPGRPTVYRARVADRRARARARRPKPCKLSGELGVVVAGLLEADWSPQQITEMLPQLYPDDDGMRVSHETIYQSLYVQTRGVLRRELAAHLRTGRTARKPQSRSEKRGRIVGMVPISQRPGEAEDRAVPGHWEGDLLMGGVGKGAIITLVERTSRFVLLAPLPDSHKAIDLREVLTPMIASLPDKIRQTLAWDQGSEMADHASIAVEADISIFFCDPHSPWQRGSNENTNGLLRQYWPKGCDMRQVTQADCDAIALKLNTRPRHTLNWQTPQQVLDKALRATAA